MDCGYSADGFAACQVDFALDGPRLFAGMRELIEAPIYLDQWYPLGSSLSRQAIQLLSDCGRLTRRASVSTKSTRCRNVSQYAE